MGNQQRSYLMHPAFALASLFLLLSIWPVVAQITSQRTDELRVEVGRLWNSIVQKGGSYGGMSLELAVVPGAGTLDAALKPNSRGKPAVHIGQELILSLMRIAQANVYVFVHAPVEVDKKTALGRYMQEIARGLARAERGASPFQPVEISEFFGISGAEYRRLAGDEDFSREVDRQFRVMTIFVLAHEYAHFALGHHTRYVAPGSGEQLTQEMEADGLAHRIVRDVDPTLVTGATLPMVFYLAYLYESGRPARQLRELCIRAIENAIDDVSFVTEGMKRNPQMLKDMLRLEIDPHAYERAGEQFRQYRTICEAYGRP
jgi:hypothetical protein